MVVFLTTSVSVQEPEAAALPVFVFVPLDHDVLAGFQARRRTELEVGGLEVGTGRNRGGDGDARRVFVSAVPAELYS